MLNDSFKTKSNTNKTLTQISKKNVNVGHIIFHHKNFKKLLWSIVMELFSIAHLSYMSR